MKRSYLRLSFLLATLISLLAACANSSSPPNETAAESSAVTAADSTWDAAMEAYHDVMSATFHPAEEGNLEPLKTRFAELATQAEAWAALPLPEKHQGKGLETVMQQLKTESAAIGAVVSNGADEEITQAITALHEVFHQIVGLCDE